MFELQKQIEVTVNDYILFNKSHYPHLRKKPIYVWIFIALLTILTFLSVLNTPQKYDSIAIKIFIFFFLAVSISALVWLVYLLSSGLGLLVYKVYYNKQVTFKTAEVLLNEQGIQYKNEKSCFSVVWEQVERIQETPYAFYFYYAKNAAFILPKRYVGTLEEIVELKKFLRQVSIRDIVTNYN